jgi:hypothetical protein
MKQQNSKLQKSFLKKIFVKICRYFGYEIIDQSRYEVATLNKSLNDSLSIPGKKSITIPLGEQKISRKVKSLKIILRSCTSELIMDQNKKRLFDKEKNEYTFRSLNSLLKSVVNASKIFDKIDFNIFVTDTNSSKNDLLKIKNILSNFKVNSKLIEINLEDFKNKIVGNYSKAKFANMANLYTSLILAQEESNDLIYFVEDDYIHTQNTITEMLFTYEKFSSLFNSELFLLPADYPFLYTKNESTNIFLGHQKHWRLVQESLVTFMTSREVISNYIKNFMLMATKWEDPWEKPLHDIYKKIPCFSPIPSLSMHCANINSVYGVSPNLNWKMIWDESSNY